VRDETAGPLLAEVKKLADRLIVGEPHGSPAPFMGPVIDVAAADALEESFLALMMRGGVPLKNLERAAPHLPYLSPAIIDMTNVKDKPDIELFGPILQVIRVPDFDSAIAEANATNYGLSASLVGGSPEMYDRFWANVRAGVINWNRPTNGAPSNAPFGGVGLSGNHRPSAAYAADYCAYPVVSTEEENARASIGIGLRELTSSFAK
jgi:succinylglutamic semialdehyde dehydrogenase